MTEKTPRKPASFTVSQSSNRPEAADEAPRRPRAVRDLDVVVAQPDVFALSEEEAAELEILDPSFEAPERKGWSLSRILFGALGILVSFAIGIWTEDLIRALFSGMLFIRSFAVDLHEIADKVADAGAFFRIEWKRTHHIHGGNPDARRHESVDDAFTELGR